MDVVSGGYRRLMCNVARQVVTTESNTELASR